MAFTEIATTDRDVDSPLKEALFTDLHDRDDGLREAAFFLGFSEQTTASTSPVVMFTKDIFIPRWAIGLTVAAQYKTSGGVPVATWTWSIGGSAMTDGDSANGLFLPAWDDTLRFTIDALPSNLLGTRAALEVLGSALSGGTAHVKQTDGPACRFI